MKRQIQFLCRSILSIFVIGLAVICTGCSFVISFNINNLSGRPIAIRYSLKNTHHGLGPVLVDRNGEEGGPKHSQFGDGRINVDMQNRIVEFKLLPNEEVQLFSVTDRFDEKYEQEFNLTSLHISEGDGSITLEGDQVFKSFRPIRKDWYEFGPEIIGFVFEYN